MKSFGKKGKKDGEFQNPVSVCLDDEGRVIVANHRNDRVQVLSQDGKPLFKFKDKGPGKLSEPNACVYYGNKFIVCAKHNHWLKVDKSGTFLYKIEEQDKDNGQLFYSRGLCFQKCGNHHNRLVCNVGNHRDDQFTLEGCFTGKTLDKLQYPIAITETPDRPILVTDTETKTIHILKLLISIIVANQTNANPGITTKKRKRELSMVEGISE